MTTLSADSLTIQWEHFLSDKKLPLLVNNEPSLSFLEDLKFLQAIKSVHSLKENSLIELDSLEDIYYLTILQNGLLKVITIHEGSWGKVAALGGKLDYDQHTGELYVETKCLFDFEFKNEELDNNLIIELLIEDFCLAEKVINMFIKEN